MISTAGVMSMAAEEDIPEVVLVVFCGMLEVVTVVFCDMPEVVTVVCCGTLEVITVVCWGTLEVASVSRGTGAGTIDLSVAISAVVDTSLSFPHVFDDSLSFCRTTVGDTAVISNGDWLRDLLHNSFKFSLLVSKGNSNESCPVHVVVSIIATAGACIIFSSVCFTNFLLELFRTIFFGFFFCIHRCDKHSVAVRRLLQPTNIHTQ